MSLNRRRDPLIVDTVELAADGVKEFTPVNRDGTIAGAGESAYGFTMSSGDTGHHVAVARLGFFPVIVETASEVDDEGVELVVSADGKVTSVVGGAQEAYVVAVSEEAASADGAQTGAWVDCLSPGRIREY